jgi:hypothetical protein
LFFSCSCGHITRGSCPLTPTPTHKHMHIYIDYFKKGIFCVCSSPSCRSVSVYFLPLYRYTLDLLVSLPVVEKM